MNKGISLFAALAACIFLLCGCGANAGTSDSKDLHTDTPVSFSNDKNDNTDTSESEARDADNGSVKGDLPFQMIWYGNDLLKIRIREDVATHLLESDQALLLIKDAGDGELIVTGQIELFTEDDYAGDVRAICLSYTGDDGEEIYDHGYRSKLEIADGYYNYQILPGKFVFVSRPDDNNVLMPYDYTERIIKYNDFVTSDGASDILPDTFVYVEGGADTGITDQWRKELEKLISKEDLESLGPVPSNIAVVKYEKPRVPHFTFRIYDKHNDLGVLYAHGMAIDEISYVTATVTKVYVLDDNGNEVNTAAILYFNTEEDAVSLCDRIYASDDDCDKGKLYYSADINQADTYAFRKRFSDYIINSECDLKGEIDGKMIRFPYDTERIGTSQGEAYLNVYFVYDANDEIIDAQYIKEHIDEEGYHDIPAGQIQYIDVTTWKHNNVTQVDEEVIKVPCRIEYFIHMEEKPWE